MIKMKIKMSKTNSVPIPVSRQEKKMTPQEMWSNTMQRVITADTIKNLSGSPMNPSVPEPKLASNKFTRENAPNINPNPSPTL